MIMKDKLALNMSRSLGHSTLSRFGVSPEPELNWFGIESGDILVLASDGLWEVMNNEEVANFINQYINEKEYLDPQQICSKLYREISDRCKSSNRLEDNATLVIVPFSIMLSSTNQKNTNVH